MVDFSITRILFINGIYSLPLFLIYKLSKNISYTLLILMFILTYSIELYFRKFITRLIHLILLFLILVYMISFMYEKRNVIELYEYIIISFMMMIGLYYMASILKMDINFVFNRGYLIFTGISFLYFSSLPGLSDII
jgi:hypothetical protein